MWIREIIRLITLHSVITTIVEDICSLSRFGTMFWNFNGNVGIINTPVLLLLFKKFFFFSTEKPIRNVIIIFLRRVLRETRYWPCRNYLIMHNIYNYNYIGMSSKACWVGLVLVFLFFFIHYYIFFRSHTKILTYKSQILYNSPVRIWRAPRDIEIWNV